jgi:hypothetical protein
MLEAIHVGTKCLLQDGNHHKVKSTRTYASTQWQLLEKESGKYHPMEKKKRQKKLVALFVCWKDVSNYEQNASLKVKAKRLSG